MTSAVCACGRYTSGLTRTLACLVTSCFYRLCTFCCRDVTIASTTSLHMIRTSVSQLAGSTTRLKLSASGRALRVSSRLWLAQYHAQMTWRGLRSWTSQFWASAAFCNLDIIWVCLSTLVVEAGKWSYGNGCFYLGMLNELRLFDVRIKTDDWFSQQITNRLFQLRLVAAVNSAVTSFLLFTAWSAGALSLWSAAVAGVGHVNTPLPA